MDYLRSYEGFRTNLAKAGIAGSLLFSPVQSKSQDPLSKDRLEIQEFDKSEEVKTQILEISTKRRSVSNDTILNGILDEIELSLYSDSSDKYVELFGKLTTHLENKYDYKIEEQNFDKLGIENIENMDLIFLLGWIGSLCLSICGLPQAWVSFKEKNSDGISWGFLILWGFGELFGIAYVIDKMDAPLITNYAANILIIGVITYFKVNPDRDRVG